MEEKEEEEEEEEGWVGLAVMLSLASPQIPTTGMMTKSGQRTLVVKGKGKGMSPSH